jgi:hypothetical protein
MGKERRHLPDQGASTKVVEQRFYKALAVFGFAVC